MGDLALWHMAHGDLAAARARVDQMLKQGVHVWAEWPQRFHWAAAQVLHSCGDDARARSELVRARELVAELEKKLTGDDLARYLSVSWNEAIVAAHDRNLNYRSGARRVEQTDRLSEETHQCTSGVGSGPRLSSRAPVRWGEA